MTRTKNLLTILLILTVLGTASWILLFFSIKSKNETASELSNSVEEKLSEKDLASSVGKILTETLEDRSRLASYVVRRETLVGFLQTIEDLGPATKTKVKVTTVDEIVAKVKNGPPTLRLSIIADGSWSGVFSVLQALENLPNKTTLSEVKFSQTVGTAGTPGDADSKVPVPVKTSWLGTFNLDVSGTGQ